MERRKYSDKGLGISTPKPGWTHVEWGRRMVEIRKALDRFGSNAASRKSGSANESKWSAALDVRNESYTHWQDAVKQYAEAHADIPIPPELRDKYRSAHSGELGRIARMENTFDSVPMDPPPPVEQVVEARRQLDLRNWGEKLVQGVLKGSLKREYSGTGGWWVIPMVSPNGHLGFVDIASGTAIITDAEIPAQVIEACTVPNQSPGVQCSGAAAWTAPDVGLADLEVVKTTMKQVPGMDTVDARDLPVTTMALVDPPPVSKRQWPEYPAGWLQFVADVRGGHSDKVGPIITKVQTVAYGLATCYSSSDKGIDRSLPTLFDHGDWDQDRRDFRMNPRMWPLDRKQAKRCWAISDEELEKVAVQIAAGRQPDYYPDQKLSYFDAGRTRAHACAEAARWVAGEVTRCAKISRVHYAGCGLADTGFHPQTNLSREDMLGSRATDRVQRAIVVALYEQLQPVYDVLVPVLGDKRLSGHIALAWSGTGLMNKDVKTRRDTGNGADITNLNSLRMVGLEMAEPLLKQVEQAVETILKRDCMEVLYRDKEGQESAWWLEWWEVKGVK